MRRGRSGIVGLRLRCYQEASPTSSKALAGYQLAVRWRPIGAPGDSKGGVDTRDDLVERTRRGGREEGRDKSMPIRQGGRDVHCRGVTAGEGGLIGDFVLASYVPWGVRGFES